MRDDSRSLLLDLLVGAAAGAIATWTMDQMTTILYEKEDDDAVEQEQAARGGQTAYATAADKVAGMLGRNLDDEQKKLASTAIHWSLGTGAGVIYGALRHAMPKAGLGSGLAFGTAWWLLLDEGANTLLGLTPPPQEFPWQTHARGLAGHLTLGAVLDTVFAATDAVRDF